MLSNDARPVVFPELDARRAIRRTRDIEPAAERLSLLTRREREVYRGIDAGLSIPEIAVLLSRSASTIERHCRSARAKLRANRTPDDHVAWNRA
jgi:DNA-binding NarL/FixJ family response regulator